MTPRTVVIPGDGTNSLSFTIPAGVDFNVESVVASVNAAAAGDTIGELSIAEVTGEVIATKRQGLPIPGGGSGTETWALRLDDEEAAASSVEWCAIGFSGPVTLPSQVAGLSTALSFNQFDLLVTNAPDTFKLEFYDPGGGGATYYGVRVYTPGYYRLEMTVNMVDSAGAPVANPETVPVYSENGGGNVVDEVALLGSVYNVGYTRGGRSRWDVSFFKPVGIGSNSGAFPPLVANGQQHSGVDLFASPTIFMSSLPDPV